jgi:hypothetical protein
MVVFSKNEILILMLEQLQPMRSTTAAFESSTLLRLLDFKLLQTRNGQSAWTPRKLNAALDKVCNAQLEKPQQDSSLILAAFPWYAGPPKRRQYSIHAFD